MNRPITTLFILMSADGKISTGASDELDADNLHIIYQEQSDLCSALERLKKECGCDRLTVQSGGTVNGLFLREHLYSVTIAGRMCISIIFIQMENKNEKEICNTVIDHAYENCCADLYKFLLK